MLSTEQDGGRREGGGGLGRGRGKVSSPTILDPNQPLFISFSLPTNVIHNK